MRKCLVLFLLILTAVLFATSWHDVVLYEIMIDRFYDGDPMNNDQGYGEYDPSNPSKYSGGDLKGIIEKLDYIKGLGVDGIWITPPVANQWWDPWVNYGGYHGYWARNFKEVDEHFGDLETYKSLSEELKRRGMVLIQDIVVNHVGNYFRFKDGKFELNKDSIPTSAPTQFPFNMNNYNDPEQREMNVYHWTPDITNYSDLHQKLYYQLSGLDDLNTENPLVREALKDSYNFWIREVGVDGFRVDTAMYVPKDFWDDFFNGENGVMKQKRNFIAFGEAWLTSPPLDDSAEKEIESYFEHGFNAMLDFPLCEEIRRVLKGGKPTSWLAYRIERRNETLRKGLLVTFIDNHDMERFIRGTDEKTLKMAIAFLMTLPGIPVIYYGTEQSFEETRASMFASGWGSGGRDHFEKGSMYEFIKSAIGFRKNHTATRYGTVKTILSNKEGAGLLVYKIEDEHETLIVVMNTSNDERIRVYSDAFPEVEEVFSTGRKAQMIIQQDSTVFRVPPKSLTVYKVLSETSGKQPPDLNLKLNAEVNVGKEKVIISGETNGKKIFAYVDGMYRAIGDKIKLESGKFSYTLDPYRIGPGKHFVVLKVYGSTPREVLYSKELWFEVSIPIEKLSEVTDPLNDDYGPFGKYEYPTDITFKRQMDIVAAKVERMGPNLILWIKPREITTSWNPPFGFDHVSFQIFLDDPRKDGKSILPFQNYVIEDWDYEIFITGWSSAIFSSKGADERKFGTQLGSPEVLTTDGWIKIVVKGEWLGFPEEFTGWKIYITTWDYDGVENRFRPLEEEPKAYIFGGGKETDPYVMDDLWIKIEK
ncbi:MULTISPECIES: alpha-amylase family glycosyl hydrolase [Thermotoga]|uniref:alpha-amylase family glycosyl hydrolase n=1 Tax=Thermotoga TaxID=2335 RepID=UPI000500E2BF|nr:MULTISPECIES: alpha-amylase family glycosyl hydrolase [Thermotoga]AJG40876.1 alpha-amylase [Thermotoga sp. RQ7]KFZ21959.1 Alpha amylase, catalytic region precursor [Thermotoga neapolitana LA10]HBF10387.1 alpha-amylase [Thermotoga neapolitana]